MLDLLGKNISARHLTNVREVLGTPDDPKLPKNSVDLVLLVDVYHEFSEPEKMLDHIRDSLKPERPNCVSRISRGRPERSHPAGIPFEPGELFHRRLMLLLYLGEQRHEPRQLPNRLKPRIAQHSGIAEESRRRPRVQTVQGGIDLVQVRRCRAR